MRPSALRYDRQTRRRVALFALVAALTIVMTALSLALMVSIASEQAKLQRIAEIHRTCDVATPAPEDEPTNQLSGAGAYRERGTDITPAMRLELERYDPVTTRTDTVRLGSPDLLRPGQLHVLVLWAPWCRPCKILFPQLRDIFVRRADWRASVGLLPVQVRDATAPAMSYGQIAHLLPERRANVADRSLDDGLTELLRARNLYHGSLPVTLVIDCNRRVRWSHEGTLTPSDKQDFEQRIDQFIAELHDGASCKRQWCGNGRCEPGEHERCGIDCEPAALPPEPAAPVEVSAPPAPAPRSSPRVSKPEKACPKDCPRCTPGGKCITKDPPRDPALCGNARCERGESSTNCCKDCPCAEPLVCRVESPSRQFCAPKPLARCGDLRCDPGETSETCCMDCACSSGLVCGETGSGRLRCGPRPLQ